MTELVDGSDQAAIGVFDNEELVAEGQAQQDAATDDARRSEAVLREAETPRPRPL